jgi:hypothetical protein
MCSAACLHTNQSQSYLNHLVHICQVKHILIAHVAAFTLISLFKYTAFKKINIERSYCVRSDVYLLLPPIFFVIKPFPHMLQLKWHWHFRSLSTDKSMCMCVCVCVSLWSSARINLYAKNSKVERSEQERWWVCCLLCYNYHVWVLRPVSIFHGTSEWIPVSSCKTWLCDDV